MNQTIIDPYGGGQIPAAARAAYVERNRQLLEEAANPYPSPNNNNNNNNNNNRYFNNPHSNRISPPQYDDLSDLEELDSKFRATSLNKPKSSRRVGRDEEEDPHLSSILPRASDHFTESKAAKPFAFNSNRPGFATNPFLEPLSNNTQPPKPPKPPHSSQPKSQPLRQFYSGPVTQKYDNDDDDDDDEFDPIRDAHAFEDEEYDLPDIDGNPSFKKRLDQKIPQLGLFAENRNIEKHLFDPSASKKEPLFMPFDDSIDAGFDEQDKQYQLAVKRGEIDEEQPFSKLSAFLNEQNLPDQATLDADDEEIEYLMQKLSHIRTTQDVKTKAKVAGKPYWDNYTPPNLLDLGLDPHDAGYTDDEIEQVFGKVLQIDRKRVQGEELTPEEQGYMPPLTEAELNERVAAIQARKEIYLQELKQKQWREKRHAFNRVLQTLVWCAHEAIFEGEQKNRAPQKPTFFRFLRDDADEFDPGEYTYDYDPKFRSLEDIEIKDHIDYYIRYQADFFNPISVIMSGAIDEAILAHEDWDSSAGKLWYKDDDDDLRVGNGETRKETDLQMRARIIQEHDETILTQKLWGQPIEEQPGLSYAVRKLFEMAPPFDSENITPIDILLSDADSFINYAI